MKMKKSKIHITVLVTLLLVFQNNLKEISSYFSYVDELIVIILVVYLIGHTVGTGKILKRDFILLSIILLVVFIGISSNFINEINTMSISIAIDIISFLKVPLLFIFGLNFLNSNEKKEYFRIMYRVSIIYVAFALIFLILTYAGFVRLYDSRRYGLLAYNFISPSSGTLGYNLMFILGIIIAKTGTKHRWLLLSSLLLILSTTKGPQLIFVALFIILFIFFGYRKKLRLWHYILFLGLVVVIGSYQINNYLLNQDSARYLLYQNAFKSANEYFPFGTGFSTYGSEMSRRPYSMLYYKYGMNFVWGLSPEYGSFITDNYWAMIIAQFGWISTALMVYWYYKIYLIVQKNKVNSAIKSYTTAMYISFIVGSVGSAYLTNELGMLGFWIIALMINSETKVPR